MNDSTPSIPVQRFAMRHMAKGPARPLKGWKSCRVYERFVDEGLCVEAKDESPFHRRFEITDKGRAYVASIGD